MMNKPESLYTITVGQTREKYKQNIKSLDNIMLLVTTGSLEKIKEIAGEWTVNRAFTELIIQQEYIREREKVNWK